MALSEEDRTWIAAIADRLESRLTKRVDAVDAKFTGRIDAVDAKIDTVESRLTEQIEGVESRLTERIDVKVEAMETKLLTAFQGWARVFEVRA